MSRLTVTFAGSFESVGQALASGLSKKWRGHLAHVNFMPVFTAWRGARPTAALQTAAHGYNRLRRATWSFHAVVR
jgi:hypothetical protein